MDKKLATKVLVVVSIVYGMTIALMAVFGVSGLSTFAIVGALVLGLLWVLNAFFGRETTEPQQP